MAVVAALVSATASRAVYTVTGDGAATSLTIANATLLADLDGTTGPLYQAFNATYANQAAMRAVIGGGPANVSTPGVEIRMNPRSLGGVVAADVDTDAVTPTKPEINIVFPATAAVFYLVLEYVSSVVR